MRARDWLLTSCLLVASCDGGDATYLVIDNGYPAETPTAVYKAWWFVAEFPEPVASGESSEAERVVPGTDYVYLLLAPGWDAASDRPPTKLIAARTSDKLHAEHGVTTHVRIDPQHVTGDCSTGTPLSRDEVDLITTRIFPGAFVGTTYDAKNCSVRDDQTDASTPSAASLAGVVDAGGRCCASMN